ncbi:MAG: saccharopine dehydrogenase NADP-binding domain-containing protein [Deltaproteobacteria bacterium]|nr:saccharopine dehydrogenase NADP-binding domain-containing protein [Deltaproteobacteria bacterium]
MQEEAALDPAQGPCVAVVGAGGHTGRFVVAELLRRDLSVVAVGRSAQPLASLDPRVERREADVWDPARLTEALAGVPVVINCAGPFLDTADAVVRATLRAGAHYLDVTAEQASAAATLAEFDAPARAAGVRVVPGMGFFGGLADLIVTIAADQLGPLEDVEIAIALDSWHPTAGTRATGRRNTVRRQIIRGACLVPVEAERGRRRIVFGPPFEVQPVTVVPFSEMPLIHRHIEVDQVTTWLADRALADVLDEATPAPVAADDSGRSCQQFQVQVRAQSGGWTQMIRVEGRDIYAVTAPLVVEAAVRILDDDRVGAFAPGELFDARAFLTSLSPDALQLEVMEPRPAAELDDAR